MSWLMYATRSTSRTIFPSSEAGSLFAGVREDPVADLVREVQRARDSQRLLVVAEAPPESLGHRRVERVLTGVPERRVPHVMPEADRLRQILVQPQRPCDDARDRRRLERVGHPRAVVVALGVDEDLRLPLQSAKRLRVDDAVAVALERCPHAARLLRELAAASLERADGERRQLSLTRTNRLLEAHAISVEARGAGSPRKRRGRRTPARAPCSPRLRAQGHPRRRRRSTRPGSQRHARR